MEKYFQIAFGSIMGPQFTVPTTHADAIRGFFDTLDQHDWEAILASGQLPGTTKTGEVFGQVFGAVIGELNANGTLTEGTVKNPHVLHTKTLNTSGHLIFGVASGVHCDEHEPCTFRVLLRTGPSRKKHTIDRRAFVPSFLRPGQVRVVSLHLHSDGSHDKHDGVCQ